MYLRVCGLHVFPMNSALCGMCTVFSVDHYVLDHDLLRQYLTMHSRQSPQCPTNFHSCNIYTQAFPTFSVYSGEAWSQGYRVCVSVMNGSLIHQKGVHVSLTAHITCRDYHLCSEITESRQANTLTIRIQIMRFVQRCSLFS